MQTLTKPQWTDEVFRLLCLQFNSTAEDKRLNLREWAESLANCDGYYYEAGISPMDAVTEEIEAGL